jgi:adenosylhomocysteine nucleosidase
MNNLIVFCALHAELDATILNPEIDVYFTGIGKVNAAIKSYQKIENYFRTHPFSLPFVLNVGTAGGSKDMAIGDIKYCSFFHQRDCLIKGFSQPTHSFNVREFDSWCNTGDNFATDVSEVPFVYDMEAYAIAAVCDKFNINEFGSMKIISDIVGQNSEVEWRERIKPLSIKLTEHLNQFYVNHFLNK